MNPGKEAKNLTRAQIATIRDLAKRYAEVAALPRQRETIDAWRRLNGLRPARPMVRIDQLPWEELDWGREQMVSPRGTVAHAIEGQLRRTLYVWERFPADMVVMPYVSLPKTVRNASLGPPAQVERIGLAQHYASQLNTLEEVRALKAPVVEVDPEADRRRWEEANDILGGILPARLTGHIRHSGLWDMITTKVSPERVLYDLVDRPEFVAELIGKFVEMESAVLDQFEQTGLLEAAPPEIHCTGAFCDELPSPSYDGKRALARDTWTFAMAQMFSDVSPEMHERFEILPMKPLLERYGLVYYGCCEPLHHKIGIVRKLRNVRKISVSPWADKEIAAENIHGDYVFSAKPNPAYVAMGAFDAELVRKDLRETVAICRRHRTPCELILKDLSTVGNDPGRLTAWEKIAMDVVQE